MNGTKRSRGSCSGAQNKKIESIRSGALQCSMNQIRSGAQCAPQGISLISLIITIIVIIILAAIVIFNGLNAPNSAQFAGFVQQVDNVQMAVNNKFGELKTRHSIAGDYRTDEQIYIEIAVADDPGQYATMSTVGTPKNYKATSGSIEDSTGIQRIVPETSNDKTNASSLGMTLPKVRESNNGWYVTKEGRVFNANGYEYDGKTYFTGAVYQTGVLAANDTTNDKTAETIYSFISKDENVVSGATRDGSAPAPTDGVTTPASGVTFRRVDTTKTLAVGDEVEDNENERYFVAKISGENVLLLTKYNLSKTALEQQNAAYGTTAMAFSTETGWAAGDNLNNRTWTTTGDNAQTASNNAVKRAQAYGAAKEVTGRLMTKEELETICGVAQGSMSSGSSISLKWLLGQDYSTGPVETNNYLYWWLGSAYSTSRVWYVSGSGLYGNTYSKGSSLGVRPVLEVSASNIS